MKISIDTKEDSPEEIRKVIEILRTAVGDEVFSNEPLTAEPLAESAAVEEPSSAQTQNMFSMFGAAPVASAEPTDASSLVEEIDTTTPETTESVDESKDDIESLLDISPKKVNDELDLDFELETYDD